MHAAAAAAPVPLPLPAPAGSTPSTLPSPSMSYTSTTSSTPGFIPQLWQQRRSRSLELLRQYSHMIDWVADFGCNACALGSVLVNSCDFARVTCVDLDPAVLRAVNVEPLVRQPEGGRDGDEDEGEDGEGVDRWRERPMRIELMNGSIVEYDERVRGVDAIVLSEVIEHLDPEPLAQLPRALFDFYRPKIVIVSTPNQTFNLHFPDPTRMRDPDHRFEWTEPQFTAWCDTQAAQYGYTYTLSGVGLWPCCARGEHEPRGYASQFATFLRADLMGKVAADEACVQKWPVRVPGMAWEVDDGQCDSGLDAAGAAAEARDKTRPWTSIKTFDLPAYPGADLTSIHAAGSPDLAQWTLTPAQAKVLKRVLDALLHHLCPAAVGVPNASSYYCTLAQAWSQPAVRQAFRVPGALVEFLQLPGLGAKVGIEWIRPKDVASVRPERMYEVVWGKADAGRIERCDEGKASVLEELIRERMRELVEREEREQGREFEDEWRDSGDDLSDWDENEQQGAGSDTGDEDEVGYEIAYGVSDNGPTWSQGSAWGQDQGEAGDGGEWNSSEEREDVNWAK